MTGSRRALRAALGFALAGALVLSLALSAHAAPRVVLASRTSEGALADGHSVGGVLSRNGSLEVFDSKADNLPGSIRFTQEVYVRNFDQGTTELVSVNNNGDPADDSVFGVASSANGRFVVLWGRPSNLPGGDDRTSLVWIHNRSTGTTRLVARANNGDPADHNCYPGSVSASGRFVAFYCYADNLPNGDGSNPFVYVRDVFTGKTRLASKTNRGKPATGETYSQAISSSGRWVAFASTDRGLPGGDGHTDHVYLRNLDRRHTKLIDRNRSGEVAEEDGTGPAVSGNGRFVKFSSYADNLPGGDGIHSQVYLRDSRRGRTRLVSRNNAGDPLNGEAYVGHVSGSGRYVVFTASGSNLPGASRATEQVYLRDMRRRQTRLLSKAANGDPALHSSYAPATSISLDGHWAAFFSDADNLGGITRYYNVFRAGPIG